MGFFDNKTEEEKRIEKEKGYLLSLMSRINYSNNLDAFTTKVLVKYLNGVLNGTVKNDFFDYEFLYRVFDQLTVNEYENGDDVEEHLDKIKECIKELLPFGSSTAQYEEIKELIINEFVAPHGYIAKGIYDFRIFNKCNKDVHQYAYIMKSIAKNDNAVKNFDKVAEFANNVTKWCYTREEFTDRLLSAVDGLKNGVVDVEVYFAEQLEVAQASKGYYALSDRMIQQGIKTVHQMDEKIQKIDDRIDVLEQKGREARLLAETGVQDIETAKNNALQEIRKETRESLNSIDNRVNSKIRDLFDKLDNHFEELKSALADKADEVISEQIRKCSSQLEDLKIQSENQQKLNASSFRTFKEESQKLIDRLNDYIKNHPDLEATAEQITATEKLRETISELINQNKELMETPGYNEIRREVPVVPEVEQPSSEEVDVEGIDRKVIACVPNIVIPKSIRIYDDVKLLDSYDFDLNDHKAFEAKMKVIRNKMKEGEKAGKVYHRETEHIIRCLMSGDWPYIYGPPGAGKGYIISQVGELLEQPVLFAGKIGEVHTILGYIDAQGRFRAPHGFVACIKGTILVFDEFDNGNSDSRVAINGMFDALAHKIDDPSSNQYIQFANEINVPVNPNMRIIATGNTDATSIDPRIWPDRYPSDESLRDRYKVIYIPYDPRVDKHILRNFPDWYGFFKNFRIVCKDYTIDSHKTTVLGNASTRDAASLKKCLTLRSKTMDELMFELFVQTKDVNYRTAIGDAMANIYGIDSNQTSLESYTGVIGEASEKVIAKHFVKACNLGIERDYGDE